MYKTLSAPHVVQIEVSPMCPNQCMHCYNFWRQKDEKMTNLLNSLSLPQIDKILKQLIAHKIFHLVLTGGEPLLNKKVLFRILEKAKENNITVSVNSTLISLTEKEAIRFKELGVLVVLTSLLGPTAEIHNRIAQKKLAFEKTTNGISILRKIGVPVAVNMVVSKKNQHLIRETAIFVKSLGIKSFNATRAGCPGNCNDFSELSLNLDEFRSYLEELHSIGNDEKLIVDVLSSYPICGIKEVDRYQGFSSRRCMAGVNTITISANGDVRPCGHFDISYGNLLEEDLSDIWQRMTEWRDGSMLPTDCRSCRALPWCGGGCRMEAKMRNGSCTELDPYSSPVDADYVYQQMANRKKEKTSLPLTVQLNPKIRWRKEKFGGTFFVGARFACYLNPKGVNFLNCLPKGTDLQISDLIGKLEQNQENFILGLIERNIFISNNFN